MHIGLSLEQPLDDMQMPLTARQMKGLQEEEEEEEGEEEREEEKRRKKVMSDVPQHKQEAYRSPVVVGFVHVHAIVKQASELLDIARCGSFAELDADLAAGQAVPYALDVRANDLDHLVVLRPHRVVDRRVVKLVFGVCVCPQLQQHADQLVMALAGSDMQSRALVLILVEDADVPAGQDGLHFDDIADEGCVEEEVQSVSLPLVLELLDLVVRVVVLVRVLLVGRVLHTR
eukprot:766727-Hanusia_phi.AAC.7